MQLLEYSSLYQLFTTTANCSVLAQFTFTPLECDQTQCYSMQFDPRSTLFGKFQPTRFSPVQSVPKPTIAGLFATKDRQRSNLGEHRRRSTLQCEVQQILDQPEEEVRQNEMYYLPPSKCHSHQNKCCSPLNRNGRGRKYSIHFNSRCCASHKLL